MHTEYDVSIVVACYNEEPHLKDSVNEIEKVLDDTRYSYELIFIDDCSQDNTREVIKNICEVKNNFSYSFHDKNKGRGATVREGLLIAKGKYAGFLDIDLEVHARYIPSMIKALRSGYDFSGAQRTYNLLQCGGVVRAFISVVYRMLIKNCLKMEANDTEAGYKFFNMETTREVIKKTQNDKWFWDTEIIYELIRADKKVIEIPCLFIRNYNKQSTVRLIPDIIEYLIALKKFKKSKNKIDKNR